MITKLFVCLFVFVNALKSYTVLLLHCFYTVDHYNQNCCTNFFLWIFLSMQINSFFFTIYWFFFFVEIVEKLEQSSSWNFFYSKKAHFNTFSQYLAIFLIDDRVAVRWYRFLFFLLLVMRRDQNTISSRCKGGGLRKDPGQNVYLGVKKSSLIHTF